jgi:aldehyde:ferredoxin oxidoreductase
MRIARINVNRETIIFEEIVSDSKYFLLGGRGLSSKIVNEEVPANCDPLGKENKLVIASGLLTGSPFPNSARTSVGSKSPLTNGIKEANVGGRPSMMLASHGLRGIILEDEAPKLKLIIIDQKGIRLESAEKYKGLGNYQLHSELRSRYGERIGVYSIGPAGESMMRASSIAANDLEGYPSRQAARGGLGAVMGAKRIKAIIILPIESSRVKIHDINKFRAVSKPFAKNLADTRKTFSVYGTALMTKAMSTLGGLPTKNFSMGSFDQVEKISGEKLHELVTARNGTKRVSCSPTCVIKCSNIFLDEEGKHVTSSFEYETIALNGSNLLIDNLDQLAKIDHLCDDIGIDTIEFGVTMGVAMENGKIEWGNAEKVFEILEEIRKNSEIGKLYGNGVYRLGKKLNAKRIPHVKGQGISGYEPRVFKGMSITFATSPMGADHTSGAAIAGRTASKDKDYGELTDNKGKLELSYELQIYTAVLDSMGCCYFIGPSFENMELIAKAINAMYNLNLTRDDVIKIGKDILKTELGFNEKAGLSKETNVLPSFFREEPSKPLGLKVTLSEDDLKNFWRKLKGN